MVVSTKTRYGLRFMINLGLKFNNGIVQIKEVAEKELISIKYLEHIASILKHSGLVKVERGAKGGYYLSKSPDNITLKEIIETLEGSLQLTECNNNEKNTCELSDKCVTSGFWKNFSDHIKNYLDSLTLNELVNDYKEKNRNLMYYI